MMVVMTAGQLLLASGQTFNRRYDPFGQGYTQTAWDIERNGSNGFAVVVITNFEDSLNIYLTVALIRIDSAGEVLSEDLMISGLNSIYAGWANCAAIGPDGEVIIGGAVLPYVGLIRPVVFSFAANGDSLWYRDYGDEDNEWVGRQALICKDGGYMLCGETSFTGALDGFLLKTDSSGTEQWRRTYGGSSFWDFATSVDTTNSDGYFIGGASQLSPTNFDMWVLRVTSEGDTLWTMRWGSVYDDPNALLTTKANGNPVVASAWGYAPEFDLTRAYMAELDAEDGGMIWEREYGPIAYATTLLAAKEVGPGTGHIAAGFMHDTLGSSKGLLLRTTDNGDSLWMRSYFYYDSLMLDGTGQFKDVITTTDGGFIACGVVFFSASGNNPPGYNQDVWVVKVDSLGCIVPGCDDFNVLITEQVTNLRDALQVFPNPARGSATVSVKLAASSHYASDLRLRLVSSHGQQVWESPASRGDNTMDVSGLAAGIYYVHLTSGNTWLSGTKLVVE